MLDMMDTYDDDDLHRLYSKKSNFSHQTDPMILARMSKKMHSQYSHRIHPGDPCRVCGFEKNTGRNFGVITCSTCKAFFRRNGRTGSALPPCRFGGQCPVNERTRRQCPTCRLAKCFAVGMQKDLIRTDEERAARLQLVKANRLQRQEKLLAVAAAVAMTNGGGGVVPTSTGHKYPRHSTSSSSSSSFEITSLGSSSHSMEKSILPPLSSNDWIKLTNIRSAYEHFCLNPMIQAEEQREEYLAGQPLKCRLKEQPFLSVLTVHLTSLVAFFRATIPTFSIDLSANDRAWLVKTNLHYLLLFPTMDLMSINGNQIHFDGKRSCHAAYVYVYGQDLLTRAESLVKKLHQLIGFDPAISKIFQIILFLSPSLMTNYDQDEDFYQPDEKTLRLIYQTQNSFLQILCSYLQYRYGELEGQKLFAQLIVQVLQHQTFAADLDRSLIERQPFNNLVYTLLTTFSLN